MSDYSDDYMDMDDDEEEYEFEFEDDDEVDEPDLPTPDAETSQQPNFPTNKNDASTKTLKNNDLEMMYYTAKALKDDDASQALKSFRAIIDSNAGQHSTYVFKSIKQSLKLVYEQRNMPAMLELIKLFVKESSNVPPKYRDDSIKKMLDNYDKLSYSNPEVLSSIYDEFLQLISTEDGKYSNESLWLKLTMKKANISTDPEIKMALIRQMHNVLDGANETYIYNSYLLECLSMEMDTSLDSSTSSTQYSTLRQLYHKALSINVGIPHPRILGIVKEVGGLVYSQLKDFTKASEEYLESFKNYDAAGNPKRIHVLKKLIVSTILSKSEINPFQSREFVSFIDEPEVAKLLELYSSVQNDSIDVFNHLVRVDPFFKEILKKDAYLSNNMDLIVQLMYSKVLLVLIKPFKKCSFSFLCESLQTDQNVVEDLLPRLLHQGKISDFRCDFEDGIVIFYSKPASILPDFMDINEILNHFIAYPEEPFKLLNKDEVNEVEMENFDAPEVEEPEIDDDDESDDENPLRVDSNLDFGKRDVSKRSKQTATMLNATPLMLKVLGDAINVDSTGNKPRVADADVMRAISSWIKVVNRCLPKRIAQTLSQIEQVALEQQEQLEKKQRQDIGILTNATEDLNKNIEEITQTSKMAGLDPIGDSEPVQRNNQDHEPSRADVLWKLLNEVKGYHEKIIMESKKVGTEGSKPLGFESDGFLI